MSYFCLNSKPQFSRCSVDSLSSSYLLIEHLFLKEAKCSCFSLFKHLRLTMGSTVSCCKVNLTRPVKNIHGSFFFPELKKKKSKLNFVYICLKKMEAVYRILKIILHCNIELNNKSLLKKIKCIYTVQGSTVPHFTRICS